MSAHLCDAEDIAQCAAIIKAQLTYHPDVRDAAASDIAVVLAGENIASVAYRYGPEGQALYDEMLAPLVGNADHVPTIDKFSELPGPIGYESAAAYLADCRWKTPKAHPANAVTGFQTLRSLEYQSCEHPQWHKSKACEWVHEAMLRLAREMAEILDRRAA